MIPAENTSVIEASHEKEADMDKALYSSSLANRLIMPIALAAMTALTPACKKSETDNTPGITLPEREKNDMWDADKEYFRKVENGQFSKKEYQKRLKKLPNGETIFEDIGALTFYQVEKGDSIAGIREKLSKYKRFSYLKTLSKAKIKSFNVPQKSLKPGMLIPIPLDEEDRSMSDVQFAHYCNDAIDEMAEDSRYGDMIQKIIKKTSKKEILRIMLAIAKQESGGKPIGQFELHRWEPHQSAFSFSLFHVLMRGAGMKARQNLDMTEGQLYHPKNAAKLFLAFLCEKSRRGTSCNPERFFPLMDHLNSFARFYNGAAWRRFNPHYTRHLKKYYLQAKKVVGGGKAKKLEKVQRRSHSHVRSVCKKVNGKYCTLAPKRYLTTKRLLEKAEKSNVPGAKQLKDHYCRRIKYLLEGQRKGKFMRPRGNWTRTYRRRKNYIRRKCDR
ncbi:hypothetical protein GF369_03030 [Candidatus Peregrinibacteria bacterium]|nr:hypothetical protein [Candidatus Peregrinibacteria bacterium]